VGDPFWLPLVSPVDGWLDWIIEGGAARYQVDYTVHFIFLVSCMEDNGGGVWFVWSPVSGDVGKDLGPSGGHHVCRDWGHESGHGWGGVLGDLEVGEVEGVKALGCGNGGCVRGLVLGLVLARGFFWGWLLGRTLALGLVVVFILVRALVLGLAWASFCWGCGCGCECKCACVLGRGVVLGYCGH
jgi:hypothetical protein